MVICWAKKEKGLHICSSGKPLSLLSETTLCGEEVGFQAFAQSISKTPRCPECFLSNSLRNGLGLE